MWNLVRLSLAYHRRTLLVAWGIASGLGLAQLLFTWVQGGPGEFDHRSWLLLPYLGFVATGIAGLAAFETEHKERRLVLHLPLPVARARVGLARVVFPAIIIVLGTAATALLGCAILLANGDRPTADAVWELLFAATIELFFLQMLLSFLTYVRGGRERLRSLVGIVSLVVLLCVAFAAWVLLATTGSYLVVGLGTAAMTVCLMGLSVQLFEQRRGFVSG